MPDSFRRAGRWALWAWLVLMLFGGVISLGSLDKASKERQQILTEIRALRAQVKALGQK